MAKILLTLEQQSNDKLRRLLKAYKDNRSLEDIARDCDISKATMSRWFQNPQRMRVADLRKLIKALDIPSKEVEEIL